jgi:hypothetical protein
MRGRLLERADTVAHVLYCPTMAGRRFVRARWHHRIHLIPRRLLTAVCDPYERWITDGDPDAM